VTYFSGGRPSREFLGRLAAIRDILTSGGRTLAQGSLAWVMARGAIPIPGFKSLAQAEDNAGALAHGPLTPAQLAEIDALLAREPQGTSGSA
jgi:aryl-alcohol dehydrogenase-like predicted oxidoreductase